MVMNKTIENIRHNNLMLLIKESGSQRKFADLIDKSTTQVSQWVNKSPDSKTGNPRNLSSQIAREIELKTGKTNGWMDVEHGTQNVELVDLRKSDRVPLLSWVQAGEWSDTSESFLPGDADEWLYCPVPHSESTYALKVQGFSMFNPASSPSFYENDIIFVDPQREAINKSLVIARKQIDDKVTFKQLIIEDDVIFLRPLNPDWPEKVIQLTDDSVICGVVIAKLEKFV